jgi:hypothetical protein
MTHFDGFRENLRGFFLRGTPDTLKRRKKRKWFCCVLLPDKPNELFSGDGCFEKDIKSAGPKDFGNAKFFDHLVGN